MDSSKNPATPSADDRTKPLYKGPLMTNADAAAENLTSTGDSPAVQSAGQFVRLVAQLVGLVMVVVGCYYTVSVLATGVSIVRHADAWDSSLTAMTKTLKVEGAEVPVAGGGKIPISRVVAGAVLILWNTVIAWVALLLIGAGGRLVSGMTSESREFLSTMKGFLATARRAGRDRPTKEP